MPRNPKVARALLLSSALAGNGPTYSSPLLFTLRSLGGKALAQSAKIRDFRGFSEARLKLGSFTHPVEKETALSHAP